MGGGGRYFDNYFSQAHEACFSSCSTIYCDTLFNKGSTTAHVTDIYNDTEVVLLAFAFVGQLSGLPGALNAGQGAPLA